MHLIFLLFFVQAEDGIRYGHVTGVQTCALPIFRPVTNLARQGIQHRFPTWSSDGSRIAFDSNRDSGTDVYDIFTINTDGSEVTNITHNTNSVTIFPSWSPIE